MTKVEMIFEQIQALTPTEREEAHQTLTSADFWDALDSEVAFREYVASGRKGTPARELFKRATA